MSDPIPASAPASAPDADGVCTLHRGDTPLVVSIPHAGREIPPELHGRFVERALQVEDTDWYLERLYGFARDLGASLIVPRWSRFAIDLNRPPQDAPMYPGANNTGLVPTSFFTGDPLYRERQAPDATDIARRRERWWQPYHDALGGELARVREAHGHAVLFDAHSIKSRLPWLFEGQLPDLNLGSNEGRSAAPALLAAAGAVLAGQDRYTHVVDGRFKGGHITRHYGRPHEGVHALQLEMCWRCYLPDEAEPARWSDAKAAEVQPLLRELLQTLLRWRPA